MKVQICEAQRSLETVGMDNTWTKGQQTFSMKGGMVKNLGFQTIWSLPQAVLYSAMWDKSPRRQDRNNWMWLGANTTLFIDTETYILYNFHTLGNIFFLKYFFPNYLEV